MSDLDLLRAAAPPVAPLDAAATARIRARMTRRRTPRRRALLVLAPVAAVALAAAAGVPRLVGGDGAQPAFAAESIRAAEASPLLLVDGRGWRITRVDEFDAGQGELTASDGRATLELGWAPAAQATPASYLKGDETHLRLRAEVAGAAAIVTRYDGTSDYVAVWSDRASTVHARGLAASPAAFLAELALLRKAAVVEWLQALPSSAVKPADRAGTVRAMLADMPLPPGLDVAALEAGSTTRDRYQLGAAVAGAVACGWIAHWADAKARGDDAGRARAVTALATARRWKVLLAMRSEGAYRDVLLQYAAAVAGGGTVTGGKVLSVEESYRAALGCD